MRGQWASSVMARWLCKQLWLALISKFVEHADFVRYLLLSTTSKLECAKSEMEDCKFCKTSRAKYTCPRCNLPYCSLKCYQGSEHSTCSENFYRTCIEDELKSRGPNLKSEDRKVLEALKRLNEEDSNEYEDIDSDDEPDDVADLAERVAEVDLDDTDRLWSILTDEEKAEFKQLLDRGEAVNAVPQWTPWWNYRSDSKVLEDESEIEDTLRENGCSEPSPTKKLSEITSKPSSPLVQNNLFNVLFSYCYVSLLYNGEFTDFPDETARNLLKISRNLSDSLNFDSASDAIEDAVQQTYLQPELQTSSEVTSLARDGVRKIVCGPHVLCSARYIISAISDLKRLFEIITNRKSVGMKPSLLKQDLRVSEKVEPMDKNQAKLVIKKLEYYLAWGDEYGEELARTFSESLSVFS